MIRIGLRQARNFLAVAESLSVTRAAQSLVRSQTSVTKTIQELEKHLGLPLFERSSRGVTLTVFGEALVPYVREAAAVFKNAEQLVPPRSLRESAGTARFFGMDVSETWLDAFVAVAEYGSMASASTHLDLTPAAVSSSLRKLEDSLRMSLFERTSNLLVPTTLGLALLEHVKLARNHLQSACDEIFSLQGVQRGRVRVGTLPFVQTIILPRAIVRLLADHPLLDVSTMERPYDDLISALRCGDIDFFVGALREQTADTAVREEPLLDDHLSLIVHKGHELESRSRIDWPDLMRYQWILPMRGTRTRALFADALQRRGLSAPVHFIETSSFATLRGMLLESDRVTIASRHQIYYEETHGLLTTLPFDLHESHRPIGITCRLRGALPPAASLLMQKIREVAAEIAPSIAGSGG